MKNRRPEMFQWTSNGPPAAPAFRRERAASAVKSGATVLDEEQQPGRRGLMLKRLPSVVRTEPGRESSRCSRGPGV